MAFMTLCSCNCDGTCICRMPSSPVTYYVADGSVSRAARIIYGMPCQCVGVKARIGRVITQKCARCRALAELTEPS